MPTRSEIKQTLNAIHLEVQADPDPWRSAAYFILQDLFRQMRLDALSASTPVDPVLMLVAFFKVLIDRRSRGGPTSDIAEEILQGNFPEKLDKLRQLAQNNDPRINVLIDEMIAQFP